MLCSVVSAPYHKEVHMGLIKARFSFNKSRSDIFMQTGVPLHRDFPREGGAGAPCRVVSQSLRSILIKAKNPAYLPVAPCRDATAQCENSFHALSCNHYERRRFAASVESGAVKILFTKTVFDML